MPVTPNVYDAVPYESFPYHQTHPRQLRSIGRLFGLTPPPIETARVLELGCAAGGNIIPFAVDYPQSTATAIDQSPKQIADGQRVVDALGVRNISLRAMSILDIDKSFGTFDYIICHGVFSWVPPAVQDKILAVCSDNLGENGIAFVSFNTLPGWNMVRSVREMMMYHTSRFADPAVKAAQARALLTFIQESTQGQQNPYTDAIRAEAALLQGQSDSYLLHDHLEENNIQLYFYQFIEKAAAAGLAYLGDSTISLMYTGNLPEATARALNAANDIVRTEQYMDFLTNRRFRNTLLCRANVKLNRRLDPAAVLDGFLLTSALAPQGNAVEIDLTKDQQIAFVGPVTYTVNNRVMSALMLVLWEQGGQPMACDQLVAAATQRLQPVDAALVRKTLSDNVLRLMLSGALSAHSDLPRSVPDVSARPAASKLARYQAATPGWTTTQRHQRVNLDQVQRIILQALDGTNDATAIAARIIERVKTREFGVSRDGKELTEPADIDAEVMRVVGEQLKTFARLGLLVA